MGDVKLFCLLLGQRLEQSIRVKLSRECDVHDLRKCIMAEYGDKLKGITPDDIFLYRISTVDNGELARLNLKENQPLLPRTTIGALFPDGPGDKDYIFIVNSMMQSYLCFALLMSLTTLCEY